MFCFNVKLVEKNCPICETSVVILHEDFNAHSSSEQVKYELKINLVKKLVFT